LLHCLLVSLSFVLGMTLADRVVHLEIIYWDFSIPLRLRKRI
jgi:hypothetical protein